LEVKKGRVFITFYKCIPSIWNRVWYKHALSTNKCLMNELWRNSKLFINSHSYLYRFSWWLRYNFFIDEKQYYWGGKNSSLSLVKLDLQELGNWFLTTKQFSRRVEI
jgi:hypothetical protein